MRDIPNIMLTFVASFNAHCEVRSFVISEKEMREGSVEPFFMPLRQHLSKKQFSFSYCIRFKFVSLLFGLLKSIQGSLR